MSELDHESWLGLPLEENSPNSAGTRKRFSSQIVTMIRVLLPALAVFLVLVCLLLTGKGSKAFEDPVVVIAALFLVAVCCIPLFRPAISRTAERNGSPKTRNWLARVPWLGLLLIWNGLGGLLALYAILFVILSDRYLIELPFPLDWPIVFLWFFWLWFLPMPFSTGGLIIFLWRSRRTSTSKVLLLYTLVILALWSTLVAMFVAFMVVPVAPVD